MRIGFIGAGKMGLPVCKRLKAAGHTLTVLARRPEQASLLQGLGMATAATAPETMSGQELVFTCVSDDAALANVFLIDQARAALAGVRFIIDMSTVSPAISAKVAAGFPPEIAYLRSPVSGSTMMADAGTLTALVSGPKAGFDELAPVFAAFSKIAFHLGEGEQARHLKLAINSMVAATSALLGEALAFGEKGGLSKQAMLEVITQSVVASPLIGYKKDMIISGDYKPAATLNMLAKDLDLLLDTARSEHTALPLNSLIRGLYQAAAEQGLGEKDFFVLVEEAQKARP